MATQFERDIRQLHDLDGATMEGEVIVTATKPMPAQAQRKPGLFAWVFGMLTLSSIAILAVPFVIVGLAALGIAFLALRALFFG